MALQTAAAQTQKDQWAAELGVNKEQFSQTFGLQERAQTQSEQQGAWSKEKDQAQLALSWAQLAASQSGPRNAFKQWNIEQAGAKTQLPAWQNVLQNVLAQQGLGPGAAAPVVPGGERAGGVAAAPVQPQWQSTVPGMGVSAQTQAPSLAPQKVGAQQWAGLTPSAQQGVLGYAEQQGYNADDWFARMTAMAPKGQASSQSQWRY
jgi:hypothetical protein